MKYGVMVILFLLPLVGAFCTIVFAVNERDKAAHNYGVVVSDGMVVALSSAGLIAGVALVVVLLTVVRGAQ